MSMLAERRRKQKWSLNPRGKYWSEDSNKFGQKLMEKMGWSKGKGLGAKENGAQEHIKVSYKNDTQGMGYKESNNQWTEHHSNFSALLGELSANFGGPTATAPEGSIAPVSSLEAKSRSSKLRLHYQKFTRGKDLSHRSEKDIANIFGKKSWDQVNKVNEVEAKKEINEEVHDEQNNFIYSAGSITDYFKAKMSTINRKQVVNIKQEIKTEVQEVSDEDAYPRYAGFGFSSGMIEKNNANEHVAERKKKRKLSESDEGTPKKVKKSEQLENGFANPAFDPLYGKVEIKKHILNTITENDEEELEQQNMETPAKKTKRIPKSSSDEECFSSSGSSQRKKKKEKEKPAVYNTNTSTEEKKKQVANDSTFGNISAILGAPVSGENVNRPPVDGEQNDAGSNKKKRKRNFLQALSVVNPVFNNMEDSLDSGINYESLSNNHALEIKRKDKKKRKVNKNECSTLSLSSDCRIEEAKSLDNPTFSIDSLEETVDNNLLEVVRKKDKKKKKHDNNLSLNAESQVDGEKSVDNPAFNEISLDEIMNNNTLEVKKKKDKRRKTSIGDNIMNGLKIELQTEEKSIDNPVFNENCLDDTMDNNTLEVARKKKHKKQKKTIDDTGMSSGSEISIQSTSNTFEVIKPEENKKNKKHKKKKVDVSVVNPIFNGNNLLSSEGKEDMVNNILEVERETAIRLNESLAGEESTLNNPYEVSRSEKKKRKKDSKRESLLSVTNPNFEGSPSSNGSGVEAVDNNAFEVKRKEDKKKKEKKNKPKENCSAEQENPTFNGSLEESSAVHQEVTTPTQDSIISDEIACDFTLNIVSTPVTPILVTSSSKASSSAAKRRKSVRFNQITQERIIPNREAIDIENRNELFEINSQVIENGLKERMENMSSKIESIQAQIENDMNELRVGEIGRPDGENERLPDGSTILKFKGAKLNRKIPHYIRKKAASMAKASYQHAIVGDIVLEFGHSSMHKIEGYARGDTVHRVAKK